MELEEAVKNLNNYIFAIDNFGTIDPKCCNNLYEPAKVILKELSKKDKVINKMAEEIAEEYRYDYIREVEAKYYKEVEEQEL